MLNYEFDKIKKLCIFRLAPESVKPPNTETKKIIKDAVEKSVLEFPQNLTKKSQETEKNAMAERQYVEAIKEYERLTNLGKRPKAGWVYKAFKEKYVFKQDIKKTEDKKQHEEVLKETKRLERERIEKERNLNEIKKHQQEFEKTLDQKIISGKLDRHTILQLWKDANSKVSPDNIRKDIVAKMHFCKMLIEKVNEKGYNFRTDITPPAFAKKIADKLELDIPN